MCILREDSEYSNNVHTERETNLVLLTSNKSTLMLLFILGKLQEPGQTCIKNEPSSKSWFCALFHQTVLILICPYQVFIIKKYGNQKL